MSQTKKPTSKSQLFKLLPKDAAARWPYEESEVLQRAKFHYAEALVPQDPDAPVGSWSCVSRECGLPSLVIALGVQCNEVTAPPPMNCPRCGRPMDFNHWIAIEVLLPEGTPSPRLIPRPKREGPTILKIVS